eukprot:COSAG01_NODE_697_length_14188_cov_41.810348_11_plen_62_part_00
MEWVEQAHASIFADAMRNSGVSASSPAPPTSGPEQILQPVPPALGSKQTLQTVEPQAPWRV